MRGWKFALGAAAVAAAGVLWLLSQPRGSDQEQVRRVLMDAQMHANSRNVAGLLSLLTDDFQSSLGDRDRVGLLLLQAVRDYDSVRLSLTEPQIELAGDQALLKTNGSVILRSGKGLEMRLESPVSLTMKRVEARRYLVFPVRLWRISGAEAERQPEGLL